MSPATRELLESKKFRTALIAMIVAALGRLGLQVDEQTILTIISPMMAFIIGQGIADHGATAAKTVARTTTTTTVAAAPAGAVVTEEKTTPAGGGS